MAQTPTTVLLSGGVDSAVVLATLRDEGWPTQALFVQYGQLPVEQERTASQRLARAFGVDWRQVNVGPIAVPPTGAIPGRNDLLIALAASLCPTSHIAIGVHSGTEYVDCSSAHALAWQGLFDLEYYGRRRLITPLINLNKAEVMQLATALKVPFQLTWSCEAANGPCRVCMSCRDREAYASS